MLLKVWLLSRSTTKGGTLKLNVPEVTYELMDTAIEQLTWDEMTQLSADDMTKLDLRIAFMDSSCFTTDAIDRGGLTKHFATLISKAVPGLLLRFLNQVTIIQKPKTLLLTIYP